MKRFILPIPIALAVAGLVYLAWSDPPPSDAPEAAESLGLHWPAGHSWHYRLETESSSDVRLLDAPKATRFGAKVELAGAVVLRSYGGDGAATRLGLRFESLEAARFEVAGESLLTPAVVSERILPHEAYLDMAADGAVHAVRFPVDSPPVFRGLAQLVIGEIQVHLGSGESWSAEETAQHGDASTTYAVRARTGDHVTLVKSRAGYRRLAGLIRPEMAVRQAVESAGTVELLNGGPLRRVDLRETVRAFDAADRVVLSAASRTHLRFTHGSPFEGAVPPIDQLVTFEQGQPAFDAALAHRQHARQRIAGLTADRMLNTLAEFAASGTVPDHNRFLWRATGLLREHPELCDRLVEVFQQPGMTHRGRGLLLDLLTGAGTPAAQAALRRALETTVALEDVAYKRLYQRLSLVKHPTPETAAFLRQRYDAPGPEGRRAATYALGSGAGHLHRTGQTDRAEAFGEQLLADLEEADAPFERVSLLGALGNAALPGHAAIIAGSADHRHPDVREAVATALRHPGDARIRGTLVELAGDQIDRVARRATRSLKRSTLELAEIERLHGLVSTEAMHKSCYPDLVALLMPYLDQYAEVAALFRTMLTQRLDNPVLKGRIRMLLAGT